MSYLGPLRLHFAGKFQAAVSTVNNDRDHFKNKDFKKPEDQERGQGRTKGWWNPRGDGDWRLIGCDVRSAWLADGSRAPASDPVLSTTVADSDRRPPAKLVDLDPDQQMVSTIWGLEMRLADRDGNTLMRGLFEAAPFYDLWSRVPTGKGMAAFGAMYQSVLTDITWGEIDDSPFLTALREASHDMLSVKANVDGYHPAFGEEEFTLGRIVGTIGPASADEPRHMTIGRQLAGNGKVNSCLARVDEEAGKVYLDLGNALPTTESGGDLKQLGALSLNVGSEAKPKTLCDVPYEPGEEWYAETAGIVVLPADRKLTTEELGEIEGSALSLWLDGSSNVATETPDYVRADSFVFRCYPGDTVPVRFYASHYGKPAPDTVVTLNLKPNPEPAPKPEKPNAVVIPDSVETGSDGVATLEVKTSDPGCPREYIDGQFYKIYPTLAGAPAPSPFNFVSLLLWSEFQPADPDKPAWHPDFQPIFQQYANLYPIMQDFLDLSSYEDICENRALLQLAFELPIEDPNTMPATRDLSPGKREAILKWLKEVDKDGKLRLGTKPVEPPASPRRPEPPLEAAGPPPQAEQDLDPLKALERQKSGLMEPDPARKEDS